MILILLHPCDGITRIRFYGYHLSFGTWPLHPEYRFLTLQK
ncbi:hypothetical protein SAMN04487850_1554 [Prevotella aff. ruminicola Tc2-24]|uniref:Uncharacterized protein n=1 Tax=Prevotella aff. ruminicola Tc2-24 TaxID=81582 RepID=A0A1I0P2M2_9BACT|nr:hypothetical protein SAMN04487850_1554 [Prevotella aff. ruminicola Tc2-24]